MRVLTTVGLTYKQGPLKTKISKPYIASVLDKAVVDCFRLNGSKLVDLTQLLSMRFRHGLGLLPDAFAGSLSQGLYRVLSRFLARWVSLGHFC